MTGQDLLSELREHERDYPTLIHGPLCGRAAAEIKQLKEQLHYANGTCDLAIKHRDAAEAENERMRTALKEAQSIATRNALWIMHLRDSLQAVHRCAADFPEGTVYGICERALAYGTTHEQKAGDAK
jgi:hypothetical protein